MDVLTNRPCGRKRLGEAGKVRLLLDQDARRKGRTCASRMHAVVSRDLQSPNSRALLDRLTRVSVSLRRRDKVFRPHAELHGTRPPARPRCRGAARNPTDKTFASSPPRTPN